MNHAQWKTRRTRRLLCESVEESPAYAEAGYAFALGQAVYGRRTELGLSQTELARRAGMTRPHVSTIEGGGTVPTLPLLARLAKALDASVAIDLDGDTSAFAFIARGGRSSVARVRLAEVGEEGCPCGRGEE
ncbi:helix-turn-helix transcriptional regulator [Streptomyces sp. NPDC050508]|uniref:helix-turn-helix domain-containing protein n=1 Tax=Streptomyces sp. NPDC050508 TaxID=3155405 RepID=UPI00342D3AC2